MPYYALKDPTGEESYNLFLLCKARKYKSFFVGTFYLPRRGRLTPVFKVPWEVSDDVFEIVPSSEVEDAYRMLCISCGRCCALNSGAFAFEDEIAPVLEKLGWRDLLSREVRVHRVGTVKLYELAAGPGGSCAFYTPEGCEIELKLSWRSKPIICLVHHCSLYARARAGLPALFCPLWPRRHRFSGAHGGVELFTARDPAPGLGLRPRASSSQLGAPGARTGSGAACLSATPPTRSPTLIQGFRVVRC